MKIISSVKPTSFWGAEVERRGGGALSFAVEGRDGQLIPRVELQPLHFF